MNISQYINLMMVFPIFALNLFIITMISIKLMYKKKPDKQQIWSYPIYGSIILYIIMLLFAIPEFNNTPYTDGIDHLFSLILYMFCLVVCFFYVRSLRKNEKKREETIDQDDQRPTD